MFAVCCQLYSGTSCGQTCLSQGPSLPRFAVSQSSEDDLPSNVSLYRVLQAIKAPGDHIDAKLVPHIYKLDGKTQSFCCRKDFSDSEWDIPGFA